MENNTNELPQFTYPYSLKLEPTAEGYRIGIHVYTFKSEELKPMLIAAWNEAIAFLESEEVKKPVAPMGPKPIKTNGK